MGYVRMPFGLSNACATYLKLMRKLLEGISGVSYLFDNVVIYSLTWQEHLDTLSSVFKRVESFNLTVKPSKCKFGFSSIQYLGFHLGNNKLSPQESKISAIKNAKFPVNKKGLRSFLGLVSFYRRFIPNLATLTAPLTDLLKKGCPDVLRPSPSQVESFESLKLSLSGAPVLKLPDMEAPFVGRVDASDVGVGAVLLQYEGDILRPVWYASRKLLDRERKYSVTERVLSSGVWSGQI